MKLIKFIVFVIGLSILSGCYKHGVGTSTITTPSSGGSGDGGHVFASLPVLTWGGDLTGSTNQSQNVESLTPNAGTATVLPFNASGFKAAVSPFKIQDSGAVQRFSLDLIHGVTTFGGGGTDFKAVLGPAVGFETQAADLWVLPAATAITATNYIFAGDGVNSDFNVPNASGAFQFLSVGNTFVSKIAGGMGTGFTGAWYGTGNAYSIVNYAIASDTSTATVVNAPSTTALTQFDFGNSVTSINLAAGTQNTVPLGSFMATVGHMRTPNGFTWMARNNANTANFNVLGVGYSTDVLTLGDSANLAGAFIKGGGTAYFQIAPSLNQVFAGNGQNYLDQNTLIIRDAGPSNVLTATVASVGANTWQLASGVTSYTFNQAAPGATSAGASMTFAPQSGGATSGVPGSFVVNVAAPNGGSAEGQLAIQRGGTTVGAFQALVGSPTWWSLYGGTTTPPSNANFQLAGAPDGSSTTINAAANGTVSVGIGNSPWISLAGATQTLTVGRSSTGTTVMNFVGSWTGTTRTVTAATLTIDTTTTDRTIYVDCTANGITLTLPTPTNGRMLTIIDKANNCGNAAGGKQLTLARHAAESIDGTAANVTTSTSGFRFNIYSDGTNWYTQNGTKFQILLLPFILFGRRKRKAANDTADSFKKAA